jgi:oligopeptide transport system permease protein
MNGLSKELFQVVEFNEIKAEKNGYSNYSYWKSTFRTFFKNKLSTALLILVCVLVLMSFLYPVISTTDPNKLSLDVAMWNNKPSMAHWFGTDGLGRDIWARTWYGTRTSLLIGFIIALSDTGIGTIAGALWGYLRRIDRFMTEFYNVVTNIPQTVLLILLSYIMRPSFWTIVIALASTGWMSVARFIRNKVLSIRDAEYNIASQCLGTPLRRIVGKNIVPYLVSIIIMETALTIPYTIGNEVFLGFIGLGLPLDVVSLGNLVNVGKNNFMLYPYQLAYPTIILSLITVSFYIIGNKFSDASDPRNHV